MKKLTKKQYDKMLSEEYEQHREIEKAQALKEMRDDSNEPQPKGFIMIDVGIGTGNGMFQDSYGINRVRFPVF